MANRIEIPIDGNPDKLKKAAEEAAASLRKIDDAGLKLTDTTNKQTTAAEKWIAKVEKQNELRRTAAAAEESLGMAVGRGVVAAEVAIKVMERLVKVYDDMKKATIDLQQNELRTEAVLRATSQAASGKREIIDRLAESMARLTRFDDDNVKATAQQLLTLNLSNTAFERALKLGGDLAVTFNKDLTTATMALGKALVQPGEGFGALARMIGRVDPAIERQIKQFTEMNEQAKAQELIFKLLEDRVVGVAEGAYKGLERSTRGVSKSWDDLLKAMGSKIFDDKTTEAGYLEKRLTNLTSAINSDLPTWQKALDVLGGLSVAWIPGMDVEAWKKARGAGNPPPDSPNVAAVHALNMASIGQGPAPAPPDNSKQTGAIDLLEQMRDRYATNNDKLEKEIARFNKLVADSGKPAEAFADVLAGIKAKYAKAGSSAADPSDALLVNARKALAIANAEAANGTEKLTAAERKFLEVLEDPKFLAASKDRQAEILAILGEAAEVEKLAEAEKKLAAEHERDLKLVQERGEAMEKISNSWADETDQLQTQVELLGLTNEQRDRALLLKKRDADIVAANGEAAVLRDINSEYEKQLALLDQRDAKNNELKFWNDLADRGVSAVRNINTAVKDLWRDLTALATKKFILSIGALVTGSGSLAAQAESLGGASAAGSLLSAGGNLLGLTGLGTTAASAAYAAAVPGLTSFGAGSQAAMLAAQTGEFGMAGLTSTAAAGGSTAASALATAMPYIAAALAVYALIKKFGDKGENPKAMLGFGSNAQAYTTQGVFGAEGFKSIQTEDGFNKSLQAFFEGLKGMDERIAKMLQPGQVEAIKSTLAATSQREFAFPKGDQTAGAQLTKQYLTSKYGAVFDQISPGIGDKIRNFSGSDKELLDYITQTVAAFDQLNSAMDAIKLTIGDVTGGTEQLEANLKALRGTIDTAQEAFDKAITGGDPAEMFKAEQALTAAVLNRYNTEKQAIAALVQGIEGLKASAYDFAISNGERINRYGGSINIAGIARGRLTDLQGSITAGGTPEERLNNIGQFVSVLDQWVGAEQAALEANAQGGAAIAQAQAAAAQSVVQALQQQLALAQSWKGVLDSVEQAIDRMKYSASNPLSSVARFGNAGEDVTGLLGQYRGATGSTRVDLANRLMGAIGTRQSLAEQSFQRPSQEYLDAYNENMAIYAEIKADAKSEAEKAIDIQNRIEANTALANQYAAAASGYAEQANQQMEAIKAQARDLATWAQEQYDKANGEQQKILTDQLNAITGGMDVSLYTAQVQTDMLAVLGSIDTQITAFLSGNTSPGTTTTTTPAGNTVINPGGGAGGGGAINTDGNTVVLQPITMVLNNKVFGEAMADVSASTSTSKRRADAFS